MPAKRVLEPIERISEVLFGLIMVLTFTGSLSVAKAEATVQPKHPKRAWSFSASVYTYVDPDDLKYVQPTLTADRDWLHLEARYNYEALGTGSTWGGYNFSGGNKLTWEVTPMLGGVFGDTTGIAPGYESTLNWWKLQLYSEGEYVFDLGAPSTGFFYNWSELTLAPVDWFYFGLATQRTRVYKTEGDVQRGFLLGFTYKQWDLEAYLFDTRPAFALALTVNF